VSDDGRHALVVIAFIGSVFSPYYAWARRRRAADPLDHSALNVALYSAGARRWALTERGHDAVTRSRSNLAIGRSVIFWDGDALAVEFDEIAVPIPRRLRGRLRLSPEALGQRAFALDREERHWWRPLAPYARVEVTLEKPALRWRGSGYLDWNAGAAPLETAFAGWQWSRAEHPRGTLIFYDVTPRNGEPLSLAMRFERGGGSEQLPSLPALPLPRTRWRLTRSTHGDVGHPARIVRGLEDTPFYARSVIGARIFSEKVAAIHESLSLDRFRTPWVRLLLPFRMPRRDR
jgi:carotenoid 1,2-hydratase